MDNAGETMIFDEKLLADNIIDHIRKVQDAEMATRNYYNRNSKCWRAIVKHIADPNNECWIIDNRPENIHRCSGTGPVIHVDDTTVWGTQFRGSGPTFESYEVDEYELRFSISYYDEDDDRDKSKSYSVRIPIDLEINFTQEKFDAWVEGLKKSKIAIKEDKERKELAKLLEKYPQGG
jgi:hypothetical protein